MKKNSQTFLYKKILQKNYLKIIQRSLIHWTAQLPQDSAICRLTSFCDLPCRLSFPHSSFYPPFRKPFRIFGFRTLLSAFRILPITHFTTSHSHLAFHLTQVITNSQPCSNTESSLLLLLMSYSSSLVVLYYKENTHLTIPTIRLALQSRCCKRNDVR